MDQGPPSHPYPELSRPQKLNIQFLFSTWTGRFFLINTIVFVLMSWESHSVWFPTPEVLIKYGAKDPARLVNGEWWRLFSPVFVHIGIIHFGLNNLALYYIGQQIEKLLGRTWFAFTYLMCGLGGGIASGLFTFGMSAGASGAIFGLLGVGFLFERILASVVRRDTGKKLRQGPYTGLVVANLFLGFILSAGNTIGIDNAAHVGGLLTGMVLAFAFLSSKQNPFIAVNKFRSVVMVGLLMVLFLVGGYLATRASI